MNPVRYIPYDLVVAINQEAGGDGAGVRDESGIRAALGRAESTFGGIDIYLTIEEKAAVLLHGLASTQYFHNGNKRTAWTVAKLFLKLNGYGLRETFDIEAEAFVMSIATKAFEVDGDSTRGVRKASEWYEAKQLTAADRVDFAVIAEAADTDPSGLTNATGLGYSGWAVSETPAHRTLSCVIRFVWPTIEDAGSHSVDFRVRPDWFGTALGEGPVEVMALPSLRAPGTLQPTWFVVEFPLTFWNEGRGSIDLILDGATARSFEFEVSLLPS